MIKFIRSVLTIPAIICMVIPGIIDLVFLKRLKVSIRILILGKRKRIKLLQRIQRLRALDRLEKRKEEKAKEKKEARNTALHKAGQLIQGIGLLYKER